MSKLPAVKAAYMELLSQTFLWLSLTEQFSEGELSPEEKDELRELRNELEKCRSALQNVYKAFDKKIESEIKKLS